LELFLQVDLIPQEGLVLWVGSVPPVVVVGRERGAGLGPGPAELAGSGHTEFVGLLSC